MALSEKVNKQCVPYCIIRESEHNSVWHVALSEKMSTIVCAIWLYQRKLYQNKNEENSVCHIALSEKVSRTVCAILLYQRK